jgi:hypothetical protein
VWRECVATSPLWPDLTGIKAIATDSVRQFEGVVSLQLTDVAGIADFVLAHAQGVDAT